MKRLLVLLALILFTTPALAQDPADYNQSKTPLTLSDVLRAADTGKSSYDYDRKDETLEETRHGVISGTQKFNNLVKANAAIALADKSREKALADLKLAEEHFQSGEGSSFDVLKAKSTVLDREQRLQEATRSWVLASAELSRFFKQLPDKLYDPAETSVTISADVDLTNFEEVLRLAKKEHRVLPAYLLESAVVGTHVDWRFRQAYLDRALEKQTLAETYLKQARISQESGFSSANDVLDAELVYSQAHTEVINATADLQLAHFRLLEATGTLNNTIRKWLKGL